MGLLDAVPAAPGASWGLEDVAATSIGVETSPLEALWRPEKAARRAHWLQRWYR